MAPTATIVYLDADDEITSAASRIRIADEKRIALVVPYGSRLATSRINFRLLAREAQERGRRLSVVAGDAATRALAASAGLPVFGSVNEYEEAEAPRPNADGGDPPARRRRSPTGRNGSGRAAAAAGLGAAVSGGAATPRPAPEAQATDTAVEATKPDDEATRPIAVAESRPAREPRAAPAALAAPTAAAGAAAVVASGRPVTRPRAWPWVGRRFTWRYGQGAAIAVAALVGLGLLALAVAGYVLLPSARAVLAVQLERIGPVPMEIRADPGVTAPNSEAGVIPARRLTFDVKASGTFPATGKRVERSRASGVVRFLSKNPVDVNNIGAGAVVSTPNGIEFKTTERITIPRATIVGLTVVPGEATVSVRAVEPGADGNVGAQSITVIPPNEDPTFTEVRNPAATSGGSEREFPRVEQADVEAARTELEAQLDGQFAAMLADPGRVPPGLTVFGESRHLENTLPTTDPATLVGQEVAEFPFGLAATGTVVAVDPGPVETVAADRITRSVGPGYRLVDGSVEVTPGEPVVDGESITFPVSATAARVRVVDEAALRAQIKGKPVTEARAILDQYGEVDLSVWPDWVSAVPTIDGRLDLRVAMPDGATTPGPLPSAASSSSPASSGSTAPAGSPSPSGSAAAPAPSGAPQSGGAAPRLGDESPPP